MNTQIKTLSEAPSFTVSKSVATESTKVNLREGSYLWFLYLLVAITGVGLPGCLALVPFKFFGRFCKPLDRWIGVPIALMIRFMFYLNYFWLKPRVDLNFPKGLGYDGKPYILVSNHRSHLDAFFLLSYVPGVRMLAKSTLFFTPFLGVMMFVLRQIPVRGKSFASYSRALALAREGLLAGDVIHVFPESTRCDPGFNGVQRFIPGIFQIAMQESVTIVPIVYKGTDRVWPKGSLRFGFRQPITVVALAPINPREFSSIQSLLEETKSRIETALADTAC